MHGMHSEYALHMRGNMQRKAATYCRNMNILLDIWTFTFCSTRHNSFTFCSSALFCSRFVLVTTLKTNNIYGHHSEPGIYNMVTTLNPARIYSQKKEQNENKLGQKKGVDPKADPNFVR
jgi:hypothetical protein